VNFPPRIAVLALACALLTGCGVAFSDPPQGNDFFVSLEITGERTAGSPLTAAVAYETFYPAQVEIACELRQGKETLRQIGRSQAPAIPNGSPKRDGVPGNFSIDFTVEQPGSYKVECYTPADDANYIVEKFTIAAK
jgi:hypothetical protein